MASKNKSKTASRSSSKTSSARKTATAKKQTATSAGDNQDGAAAVNATASAQAAAAEAATEELDPKVAALILNPGEPATSLNSLPKDEGGLPADVIAGIRSSVESARGSAALGQPGQEGHGVGTGTAGLQGTMTEEEAAADHAEYQRRFGGSS